MLCIIDVHLVLLCQLLTLHYERCGKYYGSSANTPGTASEEEKRLTMILFTNIFDSLAKMEYDPELFSKVRERYNGVSFVCGLFPYVCLYSIYIFGLS